MDGETSFLLLCKGWLQDAALLLASLISWLYIVTCWPQEFKVLSCSLGYFGFGVEGDGWVYRLSAAGLPFGGENSCAPFLWSCCDCRQWLWNPLVPLKLNTVYLSAASQSVFGGLLCIWAVKCCPRKPLCPGEWNTLVYYGTMLDSGSGESFPLTMSQASVCIFFLIHDSPEKTLQAGVLCYFL